MAAPAQFSTMSWMSDGGSYHEPEEMTLRDYAAVINRRRWLVVIPAVLVTAVALMMSLAQTKQYRAETDVLVKEPPTATALGAPDRPLQQRVLQNELQRARGSAMQDQVREQIGDEPTISVRLAASDDSDVFIFTGESRDAELAVQAADTYAQVYIDQRQETLTAELESRAAVVQARLDDIAAALFSANGDALLELQAQQGQYLYELEQLITSVSLASDSGAVVIDAAQVPDAPFEPTPARTGMLALVVGVLLGLGAAFLVDYLDNSLRDEDDLARSSGLPVLAVIPKLADWKQGDTHVISRERPSSPPAEAYRALRTSVQFLSVDRDLKVIQVTSPKPGDGKTTTSTNLAVACARAGQSVVLVDCDLRRPRTHLFYGLSNDHGLTTAMVGVTIDEVIQKIDGEPNLSVITSGPIPPDPSELLSSTMAKRFIADLAARFDLVIVDSPPVLVVADPLVVSAMVDGVMLVASANETDRRQVTRAAEQLAQVEAPVLGAVLNAFDTDKASPYQYRYAYGRYESTDA